MLDYCQLKGVRVLEVLERVELVDLRGELVESRIVIDVLCVWMAGSQQRGSRTLL